MGLEPANHLAGAGLEPNYLSALVVSCEGSAESVKLGVVHHVDMELAVDIMSEEPLVAVDVGKVGVKAFVHIVAQFLIDQCASAGLDGSADFFDITALVVGGVAVLAGLEAHMILDHDFDKAPMIAPVFTIIEGVGRALMGGVEGVGERDFIDLLFHGEVLLCFTVVIVAQNTRSV